MKNDTHRNSTIPETETNSKLKQEKSTALAFLEMSTGNYFSDLLGPFGTLLGSVRSGPFHFRKIWARFEKQMLFNLINIHITKNYKKRNDFVII